MDLTEITKSIQEKLGKEESAKISDDIANILVFDDANTKTLNSKDETIKKLGEDKEMLIQANGNLLLQVPQGKEDSFKQELKEEKSNKPFDFRTLFDEKGNLKK